VQKLASGEVAALDPYKFMALIGKRVIHPGGRVSTEALLRSAGITPTTRVLDVGCGVGTTAIEIARRYGASVTAVDISPLMLERARANVAAAGAADRVAVEQGDILALSYPDDEFDVVIAEAVTMFDDRDRAASELARVCTPGGRVLATEFLWREPPRPKPARCSSDRCARACSSTPWTTGCRSTRPRAYPESRQRPGRSR